MRSHEKIYLPKAETANTATIELLDCQANTSLITVEQSMTSFQRVETYKDLRHASQEDSPHPSPIHHIEALQNPY